VNVASLSRLALSRTRSSALGAALFRFCVRFAFCSSTFPLVRSLPSTSSAAAVAALFGRFVGTMGLSDFPLPFIIDLWPLAFSMRPTLPAQVAWGSPGSRARRFCTCDGSLTAQGRQASCIATPAVLLSAFSGQRQHPGGIDLAARYRARAYPCQRFGDVVAGIAA
jgi:hypothetical protein